MVLIPSPHKIAESPGTFRISGMTQIILDTCCDYPDFEAAAVLQKEIEKTTGLKPSIAKRRIIGTTSNGINITGSIILRKLNTPDSQGPRGNDTSQAPAGISNGRLSADSISDPVSGGPSDYSLAVCKDSILITAKGSSGLYYGIQTLRQLVRNHAADIPCMEIEDRPSFEYRGFYHDVSRGKVPSLETLKELADRLSFYKINQLQLYIEHSFAFPSHSEIWIDSDPLTTEEILILDEHCRKRSVELVPSLSTFGHLYHALTSRSFMHLNEYESVPDRPFLWTDRMAHYTLDASDPASLEFVSEMIDEFIPLFSSDKFNICCDETFDLGQGKNKVLSDEIGKGKLYLFFIKGLIDHLRSRKKKVMMWGDILLKYPEIISEIPESTTILNWNYDPEASDEGFRQISDSGLHQYGCPGVQGWNKLINDIDAATKNIDAIVGYAKKYSSIGILNTDWGDFGHINLLAGSIPGAIYGAALSWNADQQDRPTDEEISIMEYGDNTKKLVGLLRELSRQPIIEWNTIVLWYYTVSGFDSGVYAKYSDHIRDLILGSDESRIKTAYARIMDLKAEISALYQTVYEDRRKDINEFLVAAEGLALFQALLLAIKKKFFGQSATGLIFSPIELAVRLEYWFADYKSVWRTRNKESELYRIKDVIMGICRLLREK